LRDEFPSFSAEQPPEKSAWLGLPMWSLVPARE
jgi:hypothetical protein